MTYDRLRKLHDWVKVNDQHVHKFTCTDTEKFHIYICDKCGLTLTKIKPKGWL